MKIDSYIPSGNGLVRRTDAAPPSAEASHAARAGAAPGDAADVSPIAAALSREAKIERLAAAVAAGSYRPDAGAIARAIITDLLGD